MTSALLPSAESTTKEKTMSKPETGWYVVSVAPMPNLVAWTAADDGTVLADRNVVLLTERRYPQDPASFTRVPGEDWIDSRVELAIIDSAGTFYEAEILGDLLAFYPAEMTEAEVILAHREHLDELAAEHRRRTEAQDGPRAAELP